MLGNPYPEQTVLRELLRQYHVLLKSQVRRYLQAVLADEQINKLLAYMAKRQMLYLDGRYVALNRHSLRDYDEKRLQAFWVLLTMLPVTYHQPGDYPVQIHFLTKDSEGQIIYAAPGEEHLLNAILREDNEVIERFVIVEDPEQILALDIAHVQYYCIVDEKGQLAKYIKT